MNKSDVYYGDYLKLPQLLSAQSPRSAEVGREVHDETLFIIVHQAYELWFKQILHDIESIAELFDGDHLSQANLGIVLSRMDRIIKIQKILIDQLEVLETMTPMDFLEFRDLLNPASGFQSVQFKLIENKLGLRPETRVKIGGQDYKHHLQNDDRATVKAAESDRSLFVLVEKWLERTPFLSADGFNFWDSYRRAVNKMLNADIEKIKSHPTMSAEGISFSLDQYKKIESSYDSLFDDAGYSQLIASGERRLSQKATQAALFILLYRDEPVLQLPHTFLRQLIDIDHNLISWRNRHSLMVFRMIGRKIGTGASSGHDYLKKTVEKHYIFQDLTNLSSFIISRSSLPELPIDLKRKLGFYYTND